MKKYLNACLAILLITSAGCKRTIDFFEDHPSADLDFCQIERFSFRGDANDDAMVFTYNLHGDPLSAIRSKIGTGAPNFIFRYDRYNRLSELLGAYDTTDLLKLDSWHKYVYNNMNQIVIDTFWMFPEIIDGQPTNTGSNPTIITYAYDAESRITRATTTRRFSDPVIVTYAYDENSNRIGRTYDKKINFHRTNKIWMFLDRDYSVNNPADASYNYNIIGLPTKIIRSDGSYGYFFYAGVNTLAFQQANIEYTCGLKKQIPAPAKSAQ